MTDLASPRVPADAAARDGLRHVQQEPYYLPNADEVALFGHAHARKLAGVCGNGVSVSERVPIEILATASTERYLRTKKQKLGHVLSSV